MKGQVAVEFFLVVALILGMIAVASPIAFKEKAETRVLQDALLAKRFVNELTRYSRLALLANGSTLTARLYAPEGANCFYSDSTRLYCSLTDEAALNVVPYGGGEPVTNVFGAAVAGFDLDGCTPPVTGWNDFGFTVEGGGVKITCT